jgi:Domain of unknown function (DUF4926)
MKRMQPRRCLCRPASPPRAFECLSHDVRSQRWQLLVGYSDGPVATPLQTKVDRGDRDLQASIADLEFQDLTRLQTQLIAQAFWDDDAPSRIDGSFHGRIVPPLLPSPAVANRPIGEARSSSGQRARLGPKCSARAGSEETRCGAHADDAARGESPSASSTTIRPGRSRGERTRSGGCTSPAQFAAYPIDRLRGCVTEGVLQGLDSVALFEDLPRHGLEAGDVGRSSLCTTQAGYEVEFMDARGRTLVVEPLLAHQVAPVRGRPILHVRPLPTACSDEWW